MRIPLVLTVALTAVFAVSLGGCTPDEPSVLPQPVPSSTPIFASEEEALAAAEEAYGAFLVISDAVAADGGLGVERFELVTTPGMFEELREASKQYVEANVHTSGASSFDRSALQQFIDDGSGSAVVIFYVCLDVEEVRVLDVDNEDVTPSGRDSVLPLEVEMSTNVESQLLLERSDLWSGTDFCE